MDVRTETCRSERGRALCFGTAPSLLCTLTAVSQFSVNASWLLDGLSTVSVGRTTGFGVLQVQRALLAGLVFSHTRTKKEKGKGVSKAPRRARNAEKRRNMWIRDKRRWKLVRRRSWREVKRKRKKESCNWRLVVLAAVDLDSVCGL